MPWSKGDVDRHKKGLDDKQKERWVATANNVLSACLSKGGSQKECEGKAVRIANGTVATHDEIVTIYLQNEKYQVTEKTLGGRKHLVVPVVMMVEGVHNGSHGPVYHSIDELGKWPGSWNGIPVTIDHPQKDGINISANDPEVMESQTVGKIYGTFVKDNAKLAAEAWLDEERLRQISVKILDSINKGDPVEVSLGIFTDDEYKEGKWNGESYDAIARNHRPDHLALLPDSAGACSLLDGCGIRVNVKGGSDVDVNEAVTGMEKKRKDLKMSVAEFYAVPRDPPSESKLPIFDAAHVRNAMARFNQTQGLSAEEKASARRKIIAKAHSFKIDIGDFEEAGDDYDDEQIQIDSQKDAWEIYVGDEKIAEGSGLIRTRFNLNTNEKEEVTKMADDVKKCAPCVKEKVNELIANSQSKFTEDDREWLESLDEARLEKFTPTIVEKEKKVEVNALSDEDQKALAAYKKQLKEKREKLIQDIQDNAKDVWTPEVLNEMDDDKLERVFKSIKKEEVVDYSGRTSNLDVTSRGIEPLYPAGVEIEKK